MRVRFPASRADAGDVLQACPIFEYGHVRMIAAELLHLGSVFFGDVGEDVDDHRSRHDVVEPALVHELRDSKRDFHGGFSTFAEEARAFGDVPFPAYVSKRHQTFVHAATIPRDWRSEHLLGSVELPRTDVQHIWASCTSVRARARRRDHASK